MAAILLPRFGDRCLAPATTRSAFSSGISAEEAAGAVVATAAFTSIRQKRSRLPLPIRRRTASRRRPSELQIPVTACSESQEEPMSAQQIRSDRDEVTIDIVQKTAMRLIETHRDDREACLLRIHVVWHAMAVEAGLSENDANELPNCSSTTSGTMLR